VPVLGAEDLQQPAADRRLDRVMAFQGAELVRDRLAGQGGRVLGSQERQRGLLQARPRSSMASASAPVAGTIPVHMSRLTSPGPVWMLFLIRL
jgi:hypothetical protein